MADANKFSWYRNDGSGTFSEVVIAEKKSWANDIMGIDFDGDGDVDILAAYYNTISLFENDGEEAFTEKILVGDLEDGWMYLTSADMDGDGNLDIISTVPGENKVAWYRHNGDMAFETQYIDTSTYDIPNSMFVKDI